MKNILNNSVQTIKNLNNFKVDEFLLSPFSTYNDEEAVFQVPKNARNLFLSDLQKSIIISVSDLVLCNSFALFMYLNNCGIDITLEAVQKQVKTLHKNAYLNQYEFVNKSGGKASSKAYCIGYKGRGFLGSINKLKPGIRNMEELDTVKIKRMLATSQIIAALFNKDCCKVLLNSIICEKTKTGKTSNIFRSLGIMQDKITQHTYFIEATRMDKNWEEKLVERLNRINKTLNYNLNTEIYKKITVIILAESANHMKKSMKLLDNRNYKNFDFVFSFDSLLASNTNVNTVFFEYESNKTIFNCFKKTV